MLELQGFLGGNSDKHLKNQEDWAESWYAKISAIHVETTSNDKSYIKVELEYFVIYVISSDAYYVGRLKFDYNWSKTKIE